MAALKSTFVALFGLASASALGLALVEGNEVRHVSSKATLQLSLRELKGTPQPAEAAETKAHRPSGKVADVPVPTEEVVAKPEQAAPREPAPSKIEKAPEEAAKPKPPPAEGMINLRASDTADVYLDGKKLGGSPLLGIKVRAGTHKVRFDCYDTGGNAVTGQIQTVMVKTGAELDLEYPCPTE